MVHSILFIADFWANSDAGMPGAILSCNVIAKSGFNSHNCVVIRFNKQVEGQIKNLELDYGSKNIKSGKTMEQVKTL